MPDYRAELKADQPVEDLPCLLRLHQIHVNGARVLDSIGDGILSDLVKDDALGCLNRQIQYFTEMPSNCLPFTVFIGGQPNIVFTDGLDVFLELGDDFLLLGINFVDGKKIIRHINWRCAVLGFFDNRADMSHA